PDVPAPLEAICLKAMARSPDRRYASMRELGDDLRRFLRFEPVRAPSPGLATEARRFVRRHRRVAAAALALLAVGSGFVVATRAFSLRAQIDSQLAEARAFEREEDKLPSARDVYRRIVDRRGPSVPEATEGLARVEGRIGDLVASYRRRADEYRALGKESDSYHHLEAAFLERILRLAPDPEIAERLDEARGLFPYLVASDPPGAKVTIHPVDEATGRVLDGLPAGETPARIERVQIGAHRLLVEKPGFGFAEPTLFVRRGEEARQLRVVLRKTEDVTSEGMVLVPAGTYSVGAAVPPDSKPIPGFQRPAAEVRVEAFYIDRTEVSNEAYAKFLQATGREPPWTWRAAGGTFPDGEASLPVREVSWY
ncbi:MAG TPA: SUMF1/EgtB/PvdO family nonheme iron enzyme, partial [Planctomycetota bacterium]|nr:SUMF1/EgtB/PvdO family nonheme iron enzyme [Planctomycetota bacterium]